MQEINHYINGRHTASSQRTSSVYEPATGEHRATVSLASAAEVDGAIELAKKAHKTWSQVSPLNRARVLFKFKALVEANMDEMAELITREHGKVIDDAKGEIILGLEVVEVPDGGHRPSSAAQAAAAARAVAWTRARAQDQLRPPASKKRGPKRGRKIVRLQAAAAARRARRRQSAEWLDGVKCGA